MSNLADELERIAADACVTFDEWKVIRRAAEALRWVSVEERLPEHASRAIVCDSVGVLEAQMANGKWYAPGHGFLDSVTHWMPLPEEPK